MKYFLVRFYHNGTYVGQEQLRARDLFHAAQLADYVKRTFVRLTANTEDIGMITFDVFSV
jgi:hypothetical protein